MIPKAKLFFPAFLLALALDQASKLWIDASLTFADRITVIDGFFSITHVRNPGAAFGLLRDASPALRMALFVGITLVAIAMIIAFYRRLAPGDRLSALSLGLILGGAVGNLIDRLTRGEVVDFLHFRLWGGYEWPDFNLADSFIVVGVAFLVIELLALEGETRADPAGGGEPSPAELVSRPRE
jgi:signal peptidase II